MSAHNSTSPAGQQPRPTESPVTPPAAGALAVRSDGVGRILTTVETISTEIVQLSQKANVISPFTRPSYLAPGFAVTMSVVQINPTVDDDGNGVHCYRMSNMDRDERALNRVALRLIAAALGIDWLPFPYSRRVDDNSKQNYAEYTVEGVYRTCDASIQKLRGTAAADFRDGAAQIGEWTPKAWAELVAKNTAAQRSGSKERLFWSINGWSEQRVRQARAKVLERAETLAQNRAIRDIGLQPSYTLAELAKPFVCFRMTFVPDWNDPDIKRLATLNAMQGLAQVYPNAGGPMLALGTPAAPAESISDPVAVEGTHGPSSPATGSPAPPAEPVFDTIDVPTPEPPRTPRTVVQAGKTKDGTWCVVLDGGEFLWATAELVAAAGRAKRENRTVFVTIEKQTMDSHGKEEPALAELEIAEAPSLAGNPAIPDDAEFVATITHKVGKSGDREWVKYSITTESGRVLTTFERKFYEVALEAKDKHLPVRVSSEKNATYSGQLDLKSIRILDGTEPMLPLTDDHHDDGRY